MLKVGDIRVWNLRSSYITDNVITEHLSEKFKIISLTRNNTACQYTYKLDNKFYDYSMLACEVEKGSRLVKEICFLCKKI